MFLIDDYEVHECHYDYLMSIDEENIYNGN